MPSIRQSIRSSTASKRPTSAIADGQIALNTASGTPGIFFKDNANNIIKAGPAHYGATAPNSSPAVGGSTGNSIGEAWLDSSLTPAGWKIWNGSAWVNATPLSSDTVQGLVELATNAEVQAGVDTARAVTAAGLQSKVSDSISTTSSSGIASSTAVKTAYDLANAALPKSGGIITGNLEIGSTGSFTFEGATADAFETTLAVVDPTADRTITFPDITGTVVTTGDTGTVTSTMIADATIVNADVSTSAAIAFSKLASMTSARILLGNSSNVPTATAVTGDVTISNAGVTAIATGVIVNADINASAAIAYSKLALSSGITNTDVSASAAIAYSKLALSNSIVNADIGTSAAIAGTKISPNFGSQNIQTSGTTIAGLGIFGLGSAAAPSITFSGNTNTGLYSPGTDTLAFAKGGVEAMRIDSSGRLLVGTSTAPTGSSSQYSKFAVQGNSANAFGGYLSLGYGGAGTGLSAGADIGTINFTDTGAGQFAQIRCDADASTSAGDFPGRLVFSTTADGAASPTERMRITSSGEMLLGPNQISTSRTLSVKNIGMWNGGSNTELGWFGGSAPTAVLKFNAWWDASVDRLQITDADYSNGVYLSQNSNAWAAYSDSRLKENIAPLGESIETVKQLKPCSYIWKSNQMHDVGFIAQEVKEVFPDAVDGKESDFYIDKETGRFYGAMGLKMDKLIPLLTSALQEAIVKIEALETRLSALEAA
jgi:hypothetical protein